MSIIYNLEKNEFQIVYCNKYCILDVLYISAYYVDW